MNGNNIIETNYYYNRLLLRMSELSLLKVKRQIDSDQLIYYVCTRDSGSRVESRNKRRAPPAESTQNAGRNESREREPVETRCREEAPAESKAEHRQRRNASRKRDAKREKTTSNDRLKLDLVRRALVYRKSATAVVVSHMESNLHEHANGCRKKRTSTLLAPLT